MDANTVQELANAISPEYFINDRYGGRSSVAYQRAKALTSGYNARKVTSTKRKLQHIIGTLALTEGWLASTWHDTGHGIRGQSPVDYYFDMTLAKHECMFFVYLHNGRVITLNAQQRQWCAYAQNVGITTQHWTLDNIEAIYRLLRTPYPTMNIVDAIIPPPNIH